MIWNSLRRDLFLLRNTSFFKSCHHYEHTCIFWTGMFTPIDWLSIEKFSLSFWQMIDCVCVWSRFCLFEFVEISKFELLLFLECLIGFILGKTNLQPLVLEGYNFLSTHNELRGFRLFQLMSFYYLLSFTNLNIGNNKFTLCWYKKYTKCIKSEKKEFFLVEKMCFFGGVLDYSTLVKNYWVIYIVL